MTPIELNADLLRRNLEMVKSTLADFSDADMLVRPCPGANHAAWQLGHLTSAEQRMISVLKPGSAPELPAGFAERFNKSTAGNDDAASFPGKSELMDAFTKVRAASVEAVKLLTPADMDKPGPERLLHMAPTVGHLVGLMLQHTAMHIGQFQVIRRKLGKPVLF